MKAIKHATKSSIPTEYEEQKAFVKWFKIQFQHIRIFAIPNGIRASITQAIKAKNEGVSTGVPDLMVPRRPDLGLNQNIWIEFKRQKNGKISPEQKDWHEYLDDKSQDIVIVAYGCDDGVKKLREHLVF